MFDWRDFGNGIYAFDSGYIRPVLAAIHAIVEDGRGAFVDTGTNDSLPNALEALSRLGLSPDAVDYLILTHIHLDHAGGAGAMIAASAIPSPRMRSVRVAEEPGAIDAAPARNPREVGPAHRGTGGRRRRGPGRGCAA